MIKHSLLTVADYGPNWDKVLLGYVRGTYASARYAIVVSNNSIGVMWTNDPKLVEEYAIEFARQITSKETTT
jgi:hypothetical protein